MYLITNSSQKIIKLVGLAVLLGATIVALSSTFANAATTATVTATVTVQNISLSVASSTISWGTLPVNTASSTNSSNFTNTVTNTGNVAENFLVNGQNSTNWTLATTIAGNGSDIYVEAFCATSCATIPGSYTPLDVSTNQQSLAGNVAASGTSPMDLYILTPTSSSVYTQQSVDVTLTAVAY